MVSKEAGATMTSGRKTPAMMVRAAIKAETKKRLEWIAKVEALANVTPTLKKLSLRMGRAPTEVKVGIDGPIQNRWPCLYAFWATPLGAGIRSTDYLQAWISESQVILRLHDNSFGIYGHNEIGVAPLKKSQTEGYAEIIKQQGIDQRSKRW